ncbi:MAG: Hsp20/alpha crystallin family protein [Promethearchaeota archaeon]
MSDKKKEKEKSKPETTPVDKKKNIMRRRVWVPACPTCDCECADEDDASHDVEHLVWEIPGVKKEEIKLDVVKDRVRMIAPRGDSMEFVSEYLFSCPADVEEKQTAVYENGVLSLDVPLKCAHPYDNATHVSVK